MSEIAKAPNFTKERRRSATGRRKLGGLLMAGSAFAGFIAADAAGQDRAKGPELSGKTDTYIVPPAEYGGTPYAIAKKIEENVDGVAGNQRLEGIIKDITDQTITEKHPEGGPLRAGQALDLPVEADIDPTQPGVQLDNSENK